MRTESVWIAAVGASTPLGRDALASAAAVRAGMAAHAEHPYVVDRAGEPVRVAPVPWLDLDFQGPARFEALLVPAVEQALTPTTRGANAALRVAFALGLPSARPGLPTDLEAELRRSLSDRFSGRFIGIGTFPVGHAAGLLAIRAAYTQMLEGAFDACVIAGADSYLSPETLEWLEANDQLHGAGPLKNAWGFIPGEAAGAVLLVTSASAARLQVRPLAQVLSIGTGVEQNRIKTQTVCVGEGLTAAFREALAGLPPAEKVTDVFCDMNGEPYRGDEFGFACLRTKDAFLSAADFVAPADCWGDVSAASAPLGLMLSAVAAQKGYSRGRYGFVWAGSESGERGAALLQSAPLQGE